MRKVNTKALRLATSEEENWRARDTAIDNAVISICAPGDQQLIEALLLLIDFLSDPDREKREWASDQALRTAFRFTPEFEAAQEAYLNRINPSRAQISKAS